MISFEKMNTYHAFWISPESQMVPVPRKHINAVIEQPERFGLSRDEISAAYKTAGEPLGLEGKARSEIIGFKSVPLNRINYNI